MYYNVPVREANTKLCNMKCGIEQNIATFFRCTSWSKAWECGVVRSWLIGPSIPLLAWHAIFFTRGYGTACWVWSCLWYGVRLRRGWLGCVFRHFLRWWSVVYRTMQAWVVVSKRVRKKLRLSLIWHYCYLVRGSELWGVSWRKPLGHAEGVTESGGRRRWWDAFDSSILVDAMMEKLTVIWWFICNCITTPLSILIHQTVGKQ